MNANKLIHALSGNIEGNAHLKKQFHAEGKKVLREVAKRIGLKAKDFTIRSVQGGPAVSGEVILHTESVYVQISKHGFLNDVLYRTCDGRKDTIGGDNKYAPAAKLLEPDFIERLKKLHA